MKKKNRLISAVSSLFKLDQRTYDAAGNSEIIYSWLKTPQSPDQLVKNNLTALRARSREQVTNNDYARRFVSLVKTHLVGPDGFNFQARTQDPSGQLDTLANDSLETTFADWCKKGQCDVQSGLSFKEIQRLAASTVAEDGELFIIKHYSGKYSFQLQLIDPEAVPVKYTDPQANIYFGIEYNSFGKPTAYHIKTTPNNPNGYQSGGDWYEPIPASRVYHLFIRERVGLKRGIPWMATALLRMKMLNGFEDAALVNARVGASKMAFFTSPDGTAYTGSDTNAAGEVITEVTPGMAEQLPAGVQVQTFDPTYPNNEFGTFTKAALRGIAAGLGVSYFKLGNDLEGVNYSSGRLGELEDRELWKALQDWFKEDFLIPLYEDWLTVQIQKGNLTVNGKPLKPERIEKYKKVSFNGRRWSWVDPQKEVAAQEKQISLGIRSRSDIIRESGRDPEEVWLEIQRERERMQALGIQTEPAPDAGFFMPDQNPQGDPNE